MVYPLLQDHLVNDRAWPCPDQACLGAGVEVYHLSTQMAHVLCLHRQRHSKARTCFARCDLRTVGSGSLQEMMTKKAPVVNDDACRLCTDPGSVLVTGHLRFDAQPVRVRSCSIR